MDSNHSFPESGDLHGSCEIVRGIAVLRLQYGDAFLERPDGHERVVTKLVDLYGGCGTEEPRPTSCIVVVDAPAELSDSGLIRAVISLWDHVTRRGGRVALVGYPAQMASGGLAALPPMLPDFGLGSTVDRALEWISRPTNAVEGGETWLQHPGMSRGRSLLPGERYLEDEETNESD